MIQKIKIKLTKVLKSMLNPPKLGSLDSLLSFQTKDTSQRDYEFERSTLFERIDFHSGMTDFTWTTSTDLNE